MTTKQAAHMTLYPETTTCFLNIFAPSGVCTHAVYTTHFPAVCSKSDRGTERERECDNLCAVLLQLDVCTLLFSASTSQSPEETAPPLVCKVLVLFSVLLCGTDLVFSPDLSPKSSCFFPLNFPLGSFSTDFIPPAAESSKSVGCGGRIDVSITTPSIHIYFEWLYRA